MQPANPLLLGASAPRDTSRSERSSPFARVYSLGRWQGRRLGQAVLVALLLHSAVALARLSDLRELGDFAREVRASVRERFRQELQVGLEPEPEPEPPPPPPEPPATIEERYAKVMDRLKHTSEDFRSAYEENFLMSWIHHDSALEGVVYTYEELRTAVNPNVTVVPDSSLQSVCEEIRRHKAAIEVVRELGERKRQPATLDQLKRIFLTLHPEEGDLKTVRYRKEIPQHRMYFHEYAAPDKIPYKVRQIFDWLNGPEPKKLKSPLRVAGRVHYDLIRIFPFAKDSGKVARLFMNMLLLRADYPPAILHSTERQRYYEALKGSPNTIYNMLESAIVNALQSIDRQLGTQDTRLRAIVS